MYPTSRELLSTPLTIYQSLS